MRAYRNDRGVFQVDIYVTDNANEVATDVARNRSAGTTQAVALMTNIARVANDLRAELKVDYSAYVADGSGMWFMLHEDSL